MNITRGIFEHERGRVAELFLDAFDQQLGGIFGPRPRALAFIARSLRTDFAISVRDESGTIVGVAGYHSPSGALLAFDYRSLMAEFGLFGGALRMVRLAWMDHKTHPTNFAIEGICVDKALRNRGIGSWIIEALAQEARAQGCPALSLKVLKTNVRAIRLYESRGFVAWTPHRLSLFPDLERSTLMVRYLT